MKKLLFLVLLVGVFFLLVSANAQPSWERLSFPGHQIADIQISPSNSDIIYISAVGHGLYKSTDRGDSWYSVYDDTTLGFGRKVKIAISNYDENFLYAHPVDIPSGSAFVHSSDGGHTWDIKSTGLTHTWPNDIDIDRHNHDIVYTGWASLPGGLEVYKSWNRGRNWEYLYSTMAFEVSIADPEIHYAYYSGFYYSYDEGTSLERGASSIRGVLVRDIISDPYEPNYAFFKPSFSHYTTDGCLTRSQVDTSMHCNGDFAMNQLNPRNILFTDVQDESGHLSDKLIITSNRFATFDTIPIPEKEFFYLNRNLAISSGYAANIEPDKDFLFCCLSDSLGDNYLARMDITDYGSAKGYYQVKRGWNLLSWAPERGTPSSIIHHAEILPSSISPLYTYDPIIKLHDSIDSLRPGQGFWYLSDTNLVIPQYGLMTQDTIDITLYPGWNMIAVQAVPLYADSLTGLPGIIGPIYGWDGSVYEEALALVPDKGYWVLSADTLTLRIR